MNEAHVVYNELSTEQQYDLVPASQIHALKLLLTRVISMLNEQLSNLNYCNDDRAFVLDYLKANERKMCMKELLELLQQINADFQREMNNEK